MVAREKVRLAAFFQLFTGESQCPFESLLRISSSDTILPVYEALQVTGTFRRSPHLTSKIPGVQRLVRTGITKRDTGCLGITKGRKEDNKRQRGQKRKRNEIRIENIRELQKEEERRISKDREITQQVYSE